jgi:hypothetical protein
MNMLPTADRELPKGSIISRVDNVRGLGALLIEVLTMKLLDSMWTRASSSIYDGSQKSTGGLGSKKTVFCRGNEW